MVLLAHIVTSFDYRQVIYQRGVTHQQYALMDRIHSRQACDALRLPVVPPKSRHLLETWRLSW